MNEPALLRSSRAFVLVAGMLALAGCDLLMPMVASPPPSGAIPPGAKIDCGPIPDQALCRAAVEVAITAQLNPPPIAAASLRRPRADDDCVTAFHPCGPESIIVVLQSGDTLQDVPLIRSGTGWVRLDLVR